MVEQQVRAWDVLDEHVLDVLSSVPREAFVPGAYRDLAFAETEIPLGHGERMMTPTIEGKMIQALELTDGDRVLEIGTGSGFVTACLAQLADSVSSIDIYEDFLETASRHLETAGIGNVVLEHMDATQSLPDGAFDAIAVTGSIEKFDTRLVDALSPGGRLFVVVGKGPVMEAKLVTKTGERDWSSSSIFETTLRPLVNGSLPPQFSF